MNSNPNIAIVVHGGAWDIPAIYQEPHRVGCEAAANAGWAVLQQGGSALDAIEVAIRHLEDDPTYDAGIGSVLNAAGAVELDAGLMEGKSLKVGAVAALHQYANPISIARRVLEKTSHHLLVGTGAERFAEREGFSAIPNETLIVEREQENYRRFLAGQLTTDDSFQGHDTVGAMALDVNGNLAAGNSTGGVSFSLPGRVGDVPLAGVGFYADNHFGAVACTGCGEHIMRVGLALRAMQKLEEGMSAMEAAREAIQLLEARVQGKAGLIVLDTQGGVGLAHSTRCLAHAYRTAGMDGVKSGLKE